MRPLLALLIAVPACAQFSSLAITDEGAQVYFVTSLRLKAEAGSGLPPTAAVYRVADGRVERFTDPPPLDLVRPKSHGNPQVSGDGKVVSYTLTDICVGGSSCIPRPTTHTSTLFIDGNPSGQALAGAAQISRNGRYVLSDGRVRDLEGGGTFEGPVRPPNSRHALTSDGRALGFDLQDLDALMLWGPGERRRLPLTRFAQRAIIDGAGTWVVYETFMTEAGAELRAFEVATGREILLAARERGSPPFQPSISNDGTLALYVADGQAWLIRPDGTGRRQLAPFEEGVQEAVLAGFGKAAIVVTRSGRMARVNTDSGAVDELIPRTPVCLFGFTALTPGSVLPIRGSVTLSNSTRLAPTPLPLELDGVRVLAGGRALPLFSISPLEIWFQAPFDLAVSPEVDVELEHASIFASCAARVPVTRRNPYLFAGELTLAHEDFSGLVTRQAPARPGEIVHAWAVGLGAVTPEMQTGIPTLVGPLFRLADPFECRLGSAAGWPPVDVLFAGLAPGMIGIYQVSVRLPEVLPPRTGFLSCGTPGSETERHGGYFSTP